METLAYTRPHEGGLQWQLDARRIEQDAWINWQRLNTAEHRERFDAGLRGRLPLGTPIPMAVAYQLHHVHEGGQLFDPGPVADSFAGGPGLVVEPPIGLFDTASVEAYLMWSKHVPDRADPEAGSHGHGLFVRAAAEKRGWRGHFIFWSGCLWLKDEGDLNYGSRFPDGSVFRPTRHYGEVGLARIFYEAEGGLAGGIRPRAPHREGLQLLVPGAGARAPGRSAGPPLTPLSAPDPGPQNARSRVPRRRRLRRVRQGCAGAARRGVLWHTCGTDMPRFGRGGLAGPGRPAGWAGLGPAVAGTPKQGGDPVDDSSTCPTEVASS